LANKSDKEKTLSLDEVRKAFAPATAGRIASVFRTSLVQSPAPGLPEAFDWLVLALDIAAGAVKKGAVAAAAGLVEKADSTKASTKVESLNPRDPDRLAQQLRSWLERTDRDIPAEEFIAKFNAYDLPDWDHYTHIRIAYLLLAGHGRQKGTWSDIFSIPFPRSLTQMCLIIREGHDLRWTVQVHCASLPLAIRYSFFPLYHDLLLDPTRPSWNTQHGTPGD